MRAARAWIWQHRDAVIAAALTVIVTVELAAWVEGGLVRALPAAWLMTVPVMMRRRLPLATFLLVLLGIELLLNAQPGFDNDSFALVAAYFVVLFSLGRWATGLERWLGVLGLLVAMVFFVQGEGGFAQADPGDFAFVLMFVGAPWAAGLALQLRREREVQLRAEADELRRDQEERALRAVAEERSRIARELHDVVSHAIAVTVLQARGARATLGQDEQAVRHALDAIEQTNTAALGDMRRLLAVLRDTEPGGDADAHAPQPSLAGIDRLITQVRSSGLPVTLEVRGTPGEVPPGVDLSAYRIVQEALTNTLRHAGPATATVRLVYDDDALTVAVSDDGAGATDDSSGRRGHGLIGIRERVAVVGGEVEAGPLPGGGFGLTARLPYALELA